MRRFLFFALWICAPALVLVPLVPVVGQNSTTTAVCGADTFLDLASNECLCQNGPEDEDPNKIHIAGIFDTTTYYWGPDIFDLTVKLINEGWWDALDSNSNSNSNKYVEYTLLNSKCDETEAARAYWKVRTENGDKPPHGIIGARCSGASSTLARFSGVERVPQLSATANSAKLSNDLEFPYFSRLVAPNDERGEVGALIAMLRAFNWDRVTILSTDTAFAKDLTTEFKKSWNGPHNEKQQQPETDEWFGQVSHSDTIRLTADDTVDEESVQQVLEGVPVEDPANNSRIILVLAHTEHAFRILELATAAQFQPDTIWVGPSSWVGRQNPDTDFGWLPDIPGYLGVAPFRNRDATYEAFLTELQAYQAAKGRDIILEELPGFAAETVDAIVAMTMALSATSNRRDGASVVKALRQVDFAGVSGQVQLTEEGDRKDPRYSIFHAPAKGTSRINGATTATPTLEWDLVGSSGTSVGSTTLTSGIPSLCFAVDGCGLSEAPKDSYPVPIPKTPLPWYVYLVLAVFLVAFVYMTFRYMRSKGKKDAIKKELEVFKNSIVGMQAAACNYIPKIVNKDGGDIEQSVDLSATVKITPAVTWCWRETPGYVDQHSPSAFVGNRDDCWIKYGKDTNSRMEAAFQDKKTTEFSPLAGYIVNFTAPMKQTKVATAFVRDVQRLVVGGTVEDEEKELDLSTVQMGSALPDELEEEPQMVLVEGDIVQISKQRPDGWAFGSKLYHSDETIARQLVAAATGGDGDDEPAVLTDTGWFHTGHTRDLSTDDLTVLQKHVGNAGALDVPEHWDVMKDQATVQHHVIHEGHPERDAVVQAFLSTLTNVKVLKVERVQNLALWQSFVVKRQTICHREMGADATNDDAAKQAALQKYERFWLWHGSNTEVMNKILQQGFNRSFCGKNGTFGNRVRCYLS
jgi:ABC-type branched-subunit amino acid transport system substrate-binding protein